MHAAAKSLQSCPTLCDPIDGSPPGSPILGIHSPGKNTGVGCHFLLQCMKYEYLLLHAEERALWVSFRDIHTRSATI